MNTLTVLWINQAMMSVVMVLLWLSQRATEDRLEKLEGSGVDKKQS